MNNQIITVEKWVKFEDVPKDAKDIGSPLGGWFNAGFKVNPSVKDGIEETEKKHTLGDYQDEIANSKFEVYFEALRKEILAKGIKLGGYFHQSNTEAGVPVFSDGKVATYSLRAWGDLMAAIWSEKEGKNYSYIDFAWCYELEL